MSNEMKDKVIWITGGNRGIGLAIADKFIDQGADVVISASRQDSFKEILPKYAKLDNVLFFPCDVTEPKQVHEVAAKIKLAKGEIDILINNAGIAKFKPLNDITIDMFDNMNDVNYKGTFLCIKEVLADMLDRKDGIIVNILSGAAIKAFENSSVYSATKAAVLAMSNSLRKEVRKQGISIINVLPGATETDIWNPKIRDEQKHKMMQPEDVAAATFSAIKDSMNSRTMIEEVLVRPQGGDL